MPRKVNETLVEAEAGTGSSAEETAAPRKRRVTRKRVADDAVVDLASVSVETEKRPVRRKAPVRRVAAAEASVREDAPVFNASASTTSQRQPSRGARSRGMIIVSLVLLVIGVAGSAFLGLSDKGVIDVTAKMNEQIKIQTEIAGQNGDTSFTVPVQNTQVVDVPNGGLRGRGIDSSPTPPAAPADASVATTTEGVATTSEAVSADGEAPESEASGGAPAEAAQTEITPAI